MCPAGRHANKGLAKYLLQGRRPKDSRLTAAAHLARPSLWHGTGRTSGCRHGSAAAQKQKTKNKRRCCPFSVHRGGQGRDPCFHCLAWPLQLAQLGMASHPLGVRTPVAGIKPKALKSCKDICSQAQQRHRLGRPSVEPRNQKDSSRTALRCSCPAAHPPQSAGPGTRSAPRARSPAAQLLQVLAGTRSATEA